MNIVNLKIKDLKPYSKNAKKHDDVQIGNVAESIKQFGMVQPIVVDKDNVVIIGHCRLEACKNLKFKEVPCVKADELSEEQVAKLRLLDNKLNESEWDFDLLGEELLDLDMSDFELDWGLSELVEENDDLELEIKKKEFEERMASGELSEDSDEYQEFLKKFEAKKTTDDCYTPPIVYDAVADYVAEHYGLLKKNFVRPFVPQGDYQAEKYKNTDVVVDNPPFSILSEIIRFYNDKGIKYFLFAPHLTLFSSASASASCLVCGVGITYENGAVVSTSFITNLEDCAFRSCPNLYDKVNKANNENLKQIKKQLPKYSYPLDVVMSVMVAPYSRYGIHFEVGKNECFRITELDSQKESGKGLFGSGYLISGRKKAEREKAEREKAQVWKLSEREIEIIKSLK